MNNKKIKLIAISVAMVLSTQIVLAEDLINDFGGLTDALKNATGSSVTVKLGSDISATAPITTGSNTPKSVTILGESKKYTSTTLAFDVKPNTTLTLNNITLDSIQHASSWGGAMYNEGTLILDNVTFNNDIAKTSRAVGGGAMALVATKGNAVSTTIKNSTFTNNSTESSPGYKNNGGAIYVYGTSGQVGNNTLNISDSHFESNHTNKTGGAIGVNNLGPSDFEIEIKDTTFTKNNSTGYGGAIDVTTGGTGNVTINLDNATFNSNESSGSDGGAIAYEKGNITSNIINSTFTNNTANNGGAIYNGIKDLKISNTIFDGNKTNDGGKGGAIYNAGNISLSQTEFKQSSDTIYMANDSTADFSGTNTLNGSISSENATSKIKNKGTLILNADNSGYTGTYTQESGQTDVNESSTFFGGETTIADGVLNWNTLKNYNSTLKVEKGSLNIGNVSKASLSLNNNSYIKKDTLVNINSKGEIKLNGGSITLDDNDIWAGNISIGDENTVGSGTLTIDGLTSNGGIFANGGTIDIISGRLTASAGDVIKEATTVKFKDDTLLAVRGGDVTLGATTDWASKGGVLLTDGTLKINNFSKSNGIFQATNGELNIKNSTFTVGKDSFINSSVETNIDSNSKLQITDNGWVTIGDNDTWNGEVLLAGGTLNYERTESTSSTMMGDLIATSGNLNLLKNSYINIKSPSNIAQAVSVDIQKGATVEISNGAEFNLDSNDKWNGLIKNELDGILKTDNVNNSAFGGMLQQNKGVSIFDNNSNITIDGKDSYILGGTVEIKNGSALNIGSGVADNHFFVSDLNMTNNSSLNAMNSVLNKYQISNDMIVEGKNNLSIDIDGRNKVGDAFIINNLTSNTNGTLNVADFNFIGLAPIDRQFKIRVFDANAINDKVNFTSTDKEIFTPIGYYNLQSAGGGWYTSNMTRYNPQVFRGQVATLATYNNQLVIDDMLLNHVTLDSERTLAQSRNANRYASTLPQFAPYQYKKEDGGLWFKSYVNFENLSLTQGLKVGNSSYGSLVGADFPVIKLKHGWRLMPTAYIGYNGAHQTFNGVGMYQNGGQGGLMGTFMKDNFIGSVVAYGGGYNNEMSVAGNTDRVGNWFAGTAAKLAYNFHPTKHFTIQPTAFISYNIFGRQNWGTDFGSMSMNSGLLNGINVAPGMNFIYAKETWSVYATFQYMYNINEQVGGRAGNVDLASVKMEHGYIQYGLGVTKTWKDRLNSFFQIVFRNGGRTGVGFQLGLNYTFDWFSPKSNKTPKANASQIKKTTTSNKKTQEVKEFQHIGSKTVLKSLSMK